MNSSHFPRRPRALARGIVVACVLSLVPLAAGCDNIDTPYTYVVFENGYPTSAASPPVVYEAYWAATSLQNPMPPGSSSGLLPTVACSANTAWAVLAPGWDPTGSTPPASFVVLESLSGFAVSLNDTVDIPVDDATFAGNCGAGSFLSQSEADFITQFVFPCTFAGLHYDAATCTTTPAPADAGAGAQCADAGGE